VKFDALEQNVLSQRWKALIGRVKSRSGLRPAATTHL
jgi:hypothetical protein